jgi:peptidylprolyl isomerase
MVLLSFSLSAFSEELDVAKVSEAMGHLIGKNLEALGLELDFDAIVKGLKEEQQGINSPLNEDECVQAIAHLQEEKMSSVTEQEFEKVDAVSNGDQVQENEDYPIPAADSAKYR